MNKVLTVLVVVVAIAMLTSCSRKYVIEGPKGSCGVWYPKKCKIGTKGW